MSYVSYIYTLCSCVRMQHKNDCLSPCLKNSNAHTQKNKATKPMAVLTVVWINPVSTFRLPCNVMGQIMSVCFTRWGKTFCLDPLYLSSL